MFDKIHVYPRFYLKLKASANKVPFKDWKCISVSTEYEENWENRLNSIGCIDILSLYFHDAMPLAPLHFELCQKENLIFTPQQAHSIIDFCDTNSGNLLVHCDAGISRSGAIASFIAETYCNDKDYFYNNFGNRIKPNPYVLEILQSVYNSKTSNKSE